MTTCSITTLDEQLCFALHSTSLMMTKVYKPLLAELKLTYPQYLVMLILWREGPLAVGDIAERLLTDSGSLTPILKRLEAEGLLKRTRGQQDERIVRVEPTPQGQALHERARGIPSCILEASGLQEAELQSLRDRILALRKALSDTLDR